MCQYPRDIRLGNDSDNVQLELQTSLEIFKIF